MKTEMTCPECCIKMRRTGRISRCMTEEGPVSFGEYKCGECGYEEYEHEGQYMYCSWCSEPINVTPEIREIRDCSTGRYFSPLHKKCVRGYERVNRTWKLEETLSEMMAYFFVHIVETYAGGYKNERVLWVI